MKQKFGRLSFVHICKNMPDYMSHFDSDFDAIVDGTHSQIYSGKDVYSYAVYKIENGEIVNRIAWYNEEQLSFLPEQNRDKAELMVEKYNLRSQNERTNTKADV